MGGEQSLPHYWMEPPAMEEEHRARWRDHSCHKLPETSKRKEEGWL